MGFVAEPSSKKAKRQEMSDYLSVSDDGDDDDDSHKDNDTEDDDNNDYDKDKVGAINHRTSAYLLW